MNIMSRDFLISMVLAFACHHAMAQAPSARALVEAGAAAYVKEGATAAVAAWLKGSALEANTQATSQANSLRQVEDFYGKVESFEVLSEYSLSAKSKLVLFVINHQKGPLYARFQVFQLPSGNWVATEFKFHTEASQLFPNSVLYGRQ
jgi:hypothetical protein